jgi:hypothetical protein
MMGQWLASRLVTSFLSQTEITAPVARTILSALRQKTDKSSLSTPSVF